MCPACERWNLSPLETRWEAIEEAERAFRATRLRISSGNIGLARLSEGTELVRIGAPPQLEFAAWRYGDQFGRRRRKMMLGFGLSTAIALVPAVAPMLGLTALGVIGSGASILYTSRLHYRLKRGREIPSLSVRDADGLALRPSSENAAGAKVIAVGNDQEWTLCVARVNVEPAHGLLKFTGHREMVKSTNAMRILTGDAAARTLAHIMPAVNIDGASKKGVRNAVELINASTSVGHMLRTAPVHGGTMRRHFKLDAPGIAVGLLPSQLRLALEMSLHENDERRAMEGELAELEQRWRDADAIARIADNMFLPADMGERLDALQKRAEPPFK